MECVKRTLYWIVSEQFRVVCSALPNQLPNRVQKVVFVEDEQHPFGVEGIDDEIENDLADEEHGGSV